MTPSPIYFPVTTTLQAYVAVSAILVALAFAAVIARITSRVVAGSGVGWDDVLILFALPLGLGLLIIEGMLSRIGLGYHADTIITQLKTNMYTILPLNMSFTLCYIPLVAAVKGSMLLLYRRVFSGRKTRLAIHVSIGFVAAWFITHLATSLLSCRPINTLWDPYAPGECYDSIKIVITLAAINVGTDLVIMVIPTYTVARLDISRFDKLGILLIIFLGLLVSIASSIRLYFYTGVQALNDWTGSMPTVIFVSTIEGNLGIIIASVPMIRPLWKRFRARKSVSEEDMDFMDRGQSSDLSRILPDGSTFKISLARL